MKLRDTLLGQKIFGHIFVTQQDPRAYENKLDGFVSLLQVDQFGGKGEKILWGDNGIAQFFIHPDDIKKRDFEKTIFYYDCY